MESETSQRWGTGIVAHTAELRHDLGLLAWKLACHASTVGVTAGGPDS